MAIVASGVDANGGATAITMETLVSDGGALFRSMIPRLAASYALTIAATDDLIAAVRAGEAHAGDYMLTAPTGVAGRPPTTRIGSRRTPRLLRHRP